MLLDASESRERRERRDGSPDTTFPSDDSLNKILVQAAALLPPNDFIINSFPLLFLLLSSHTRCK